MGGAARTEALALARRLPRIDLHLHLEGSLSLAALSALAARHRLPVPRLHAFGDFIGFLKAFGAVCDLMVDEADFDLAASDLFRRARPLRVAHMEILFSPQVFLRRGVPLKTIMGGLMRARRRALSRGGMTAVFVMDGVRQWGGAWLDEVVRAAEPWAGLGLAAIGVGGDEAAIPSRDFAPAFDRARRMGLRTTIHAGEAAGPGSVWEALRDLRVDRIGHGIRSADDRLLMTHLARAGVALEVCPTSNVATGVVPDLARHPLRRLLDAGVRVTINSDDGAFFQTDVAREMRRAVEAFDLSPGEVRQITLDAARHAFLAPRLRARLQRRVLNACATAGRGRLSRTSSWPRPGSAP